MIKAKLSAVAFDLDDTLYPEREFVASGIRAVAASGGARLGLDPRACQRELEHLFEEDRTNLIDRWLATKGRSDMAADLIDCYRSHRPDIALAPDVARSLVELSRAYRLGLVSDGMASTQRRKAEALGLSRYFAVFVFTDVLGPGFAKPSPEPFLRLAQALACVPAEMAYIADNPVKDFAGARLTGMRTIRLRRHDGVYSHLEPVSEIFAPDVEVQTWGQLAGAIDLLAG